MNRFVWIHVRPTGWVWFGQNLSAGRYMNPSGSIRFTWDVCRGTCQVWSCPLSDCTACRRREIIAQRLWVAMGRTILCDGKYVRWGEDKKESENLCLFKVCRSRSWTLSDVLICGECENRGNCRKQTYSRLCLLSSCRFIWLRTRFAQIHLGERGRNALISFYFLRAELFAN